MNMFNRFTERARKVILLAKEEAKRFNHDYIGTEHILLGLIREGEGVAAAVLQKLGLSPEKIRLEVEKLVQSGPSTMVSGDIPFTPKAKKVIELAMDEARNLGHNYIGTEHLLLGLIREGEGIAAQVLVNLGLDLGKVRQEVMELLGSSSAPGYTVSPAPSKTKTPALDAFGRDLTQLAKDNKLDPVIGRKDEIERVIQILSRRTKNNPVLLGEAGVGKTAIVEGLAQLIIKSDVPELLKNKRVIILDLALMVAGTKYRGQFEERIKAVMDEIKRSENIVIFIDELHDPRRVPQVHREGRRPRAAVPNDPRRAAVGGRDDRDLEGAARPVRATPQGQIQRRGAGGGGQDVRPLHLRTVPAGQGGGRH